MKYEEMLNKMKRNTILLTATNEKVIQEIGNTRFGGIPDVPSNFIWPIFETTTFDDDEIKPHPLSFLAQFNCAEISKFDTEHLLPQTGVLSFFYESYSQPWGYDPKDKGCARVYWFENIEELSPMNFPESLPDFCRFPAIKIQIKSEIALPDWMDFSLNPEIPDTDYEIFQQTCSKMGYDEPILCSKLLGWAGLIQNNMTQECELVTQGYYLGNTFEHIPQKILQSSEQNSLDDWLLLLQFDSIFQDDFDLMFGDCGSIYFYIKKEDLAKRQFDNIWLILQCC